MMMYRRLMNLFLIFCISTICITNAYSQKFDETKIKTLFNQFNKVSPTPFNYKVLKDFLKNIKIEELKKGKKIEKECLFENFKCECIDKLKIEFDKKSNTFILSVHEEKYEKDVDWCPEHSFIGSFKINNNKVYEVNFRLVAG